MKYIGIREKRRSGRIVWSISFRHDSVLYEFGHYKDPKECAKAYDLFVIKKQLNMETNFFKKK